MISRRRDFPVNFLITGNTGSYIDGNRTAAICKSQLTSRDHDIPRKIANIEEFQSFKDGHGSITYIV